jgi:hypothetical protein
MGTMRFIAKEIKGEILGKIKSGEKVMDLAKQYGISERRSTIGYAKLPERMLFQR